jgi:hypothetical protein
VALQRHVYVEPARQICEKVSPGMMYWMEAHRVRNNEAAGLVHASPRRLCSWWQEPDRVLGVPEELLGDEQPMYSEQTAGALKIISGCGYDPGSAAFRLHSAINEETKHAMAFVRWGDNNPHCSLRQLDAQKDSWALRDAVEQADVLHNHVAYWLLNNTGLAQQSHQLLIRHYHGSRRNGLTNLEPMFDKAKNALLLGARLQLVAEAASFGLSMEWSPIPMPVRRYEALRDRVRQQEDWVPLEGVATEARPFVVAHTPTNMAIKGTDVFRRVMSSLRARGVPVVMRLIHGVSLGEALSRQADCRRAQWKCRSLRETRTIACCTKRKSDRVRTRLPIARTNWPRRSSGWRWTRRTVSRRRSARQRIPERIMIMRQLRGATRKHWRAQ